MATISSLTDPSAVLNAMAEYDRLGRDAFLERYKFGRAKWWYVGPSGKKYASERRPGGATDYQTGSALTTSDFSGGEQSVVRRLRTLGFTVIRTELTEDSVRLAEEVSDTFPEGMRTTLIVNRVERSAAARMACIEIHGLACAICGMTFEEVYGDEFSDLIHVHHLDPIAGSTGVADVNPRHDLRPICPNCHAATHYRGQNRPLAYVRECLTRQATRSTSTRRRD